MADGPVAAPAPELSLGSRALERPRDAGWVEVGTLGGRRPARVDWAGLVSPAGAPWSLDWWIGADDRWHLPAREPAIRQRRIGAGPVVETSLRIPSGDARHLAYGVLIGGREMTVVEIHNDSPVPVALALALRPYPVGSAVVAHDGAPFPGPLTAPEGTGAGPSLQRPCAVTAAGWPLLVLPRAPSQVGASSRTDQLQVLEAGHELVWDGEVSGPAANAVLLLPLPHKTSLRMLLPSLPSATTTVTGPGGRRRWGRRPAPVPSVPEPVPAPLPDPATAPDAETVARGWTAVVDAGARIVLPDPGIGALFDGARARVLIAVPGLDARLTALAPGAGAELAALALGGYHREVTAAVAELALNFPARLPGAALDGAEAVAALSLSSARSGAGERARLVEWAAQVTALVERGATPEVGAMARAGLARLAAPIDPEGARLLAATAAGPPEAAQPSLATVNDLGALASPAGAWGGAEGDDAVAAARYVAAVRSLLVDDRGDTLDILPRFPSSWRGGAVEVHELPTRWGRLSFAIRWHGYRPALLWELDRDRLDDDGLDADGPGGERPPGGGEVTLRAPALDAGWNSTDRRGETLLTGAADDLPDRPDPGDDFQ